VLGSGGESQVVGAERLTLIPLATSIERDIGVQCLPVHWFPIHLLEDQSDVQSHAATLAETQNFGTQSSPVKSKQIPASLEEIRTLPEATDKSVDDNFTRDHLFQTPPRDVWWEERFDSLVAALQKTQSGHEIEMYPTLCDLLSGISKRLHGMSSNFFVHPSTYLMTD